MARNHSPMAHYKRKQIAKLSAGEKKYIFTMYCSRAEHLDVLPNNLVRQRLDWGYSDDMVWQFLNICCSYDNMAYVLNNLPAVSAWFRRPREDAPFYGKCPLEYIQEDCTNSAKLRFYTNQIVKDYEDQYILKVPTLPLVSTNDLQHGDFLN
jgi:hypothetical protein